jgi:hypothetical protein
MKLTGYIGASTDSFKIQKWKRSRYGINAIFFSMDTSLARLYACHHADNENNKNGGFVYEAEIEGLFHVVNYNNDISYSSKYRNLILKLHKSKHKAVIIKNVMDYPSQKLFTSNSNDIVVVFDLDLIKSIKIIENNVKCQKNR